jgi:heme/copper-type cytochrome/quinol oxidase subunit 2
MRHLRKGGSMPGSVTSSIRRRGITVLSLVLIIIAVVIGVILLVHYLGHRSVAP